VRSLCQSGQHTVLAILRVAEGVDVMTETVGERDEEAIVGDARKLERSPHVKIQAVANHHERDIVQRV